MEILVQENYWKVHLSNVDGFPELPARHCTWDQFQQCLQHDDFLQKKKGFIAEVALHGQPHLLPTGTAPGLPLTGRADFLAVSLDQDIVHLDLYECKASRSPQASYQLQVQVG